MHTVARDKRAEAAAAEAAEEAGKVMRLEVALAESRQALARSAELEKEVERYRCSSGCTYRSPYLPTVQPACSCGGVHASARTRASC